MTFMTSNKWRNAVTKLATEYGFALKRHSKHMVWSNPKGITVLTSSSPSDEYALAQCRRQFKRTLAACGG